MNTDTVQIENKRFFVALKQNASGKFVKISESSPSTQFYANQAQFNQSNSNSFGSSRIIISLSAIPEFLGLLEPFQNRIVNGSDGNGNEEAVTENGDGSGNIFIMGEKSRLDNKQVRQSCLILSV